jgi:hypothetical protein
MPARGAIRRRCCVPGRGVQSLSALSPTFVLIVVTAFMMKRSGAEGDAMPTARRYAGERALVGSRRMSDPSDSSVPSGGPVAT